MAGILGGLALLLLIFGIRALLHRGQQIGRWIRRRAGCLLYSRWPAPHDRFGPFAGRDFLELCGIVAAWPDLPEAIRAGIVAMVKPSSQ